MTSRSIRTRLTAWYVAVLALAMLMLAGGSWWLFRQSVIAVADGSLSSRMDGVRLAIDTMEQGLKPEDIHEELQEYAGEDLLEVMDGRGRPLYRPSLPGWAELRVDPPAGAAIAFMERRFDNRPFRVAAASFTIRGQRYGVIAAISMGPAYAAWLRFSWLLGLLVPAVALLAAAGGYWISRRALAPVDQMTRTVQAISLRSLDRRLDVPAPEDEIRRLAVTFNEMLSRLQSSVADMIRFTADASHELRTPVSLVRATAEVALTRPRSTQEYREALTDVLAEAERMSALVDDLLALARSDAGVEPQDLVAVDLRSIAEAAARDVQPAVSRRGLALQLDLAEPAEVRGTPASLRRLVLILLDNAIKYTPSGGVVQVKVRRAAEPSPAAAALIEITDTGSGIDPAERPYIFDRFYRGTAARAQAEGSGLGLSLAHTIVERHNGRISVEDGPGGRGCRVEVRLPRHFGYTPTPMEERS